LWKYEIGLNLQCSLVVGDLDDGNLEIVIGNFYNGMYAFNGEDGSILWEYKVRISGVSCTPALGDINNDGILDVIIVNNAEFLCALNGKNESILWNTTKITYHCGSSPALVDVDNDNRLEIIVGLEA